MSLIINIDTATETAYVSIAKNANVIHEAFNSEQKDHASFLQVAIKELLLQTGYSITAVDAIAVTTGPGSFTGLRVGMASAKGLAYALNRPLIGIQTLEVMAKAAITKISNISPGRTLFCPMIDARRMEVYTALYSDDLKVILPACALILTEDGFFQFLNKYEIIFFGSGSAKWKSICKSKNASFEQIPVNSIPISLLSAEKFAKNAFIDLAYSEPEYIKEFYIKSQ